MNRRDFLKLTGLATTALLAACTAAPDQPDASPTSPHFPPATSSAALPPPAVSSPASNPGRAAGGEGTVLVIGAGVAGLAAAEALRQHGIPVTILEGRDRPGGRIWTSRKWPESPADLGASWIHGANGNPLTELARQAKVQTAPTDYENAWGCSADGEELSNRDWKQLEKLGDAVLEEITDWGGRGRDLSVQQALEQEFDLEDYSSAERQALDFYLNTTLEHELAADISELSARRTDDTGEFGGRDLLFPNGYDWLIKQLTGASPSAGALDLRLGHTVRKIRYNGKGVTVSGTDAGGASFEIKARQAIITLPVGVLKQGKLDLPLTADKRAALEVLGSGLLNKVFLKFPAAFWPKQPELINIIAERKGEWAEWLNIYHYTKHPVLLAFNAATFARQLEQQSDNEIVAQALSVLRRITRSNTNGRANDWGEVPDPLDWQITRWAADPFALGSYSFNAVGGGKEARRALAAPIEDRLFFAGEATSEDYPATVHGAYLSGLREAKRVL